MNGCFRKLRLNLLGACGKHGFVIVQHVDDHGLGSTIFRHAFPDSTAGSGNDGCVTFTKYLLAKGSCHGHGDLFAFFDVVV